VEKRYQVFVSSTYTDLMEERSEVMQALLELECMPSGMELFPAATESQWAWITKVIDESDYYLVIISGRYGSTHRDTGLSYTEMEYRYAVDAGKPVVAFLHEDPSALQQKFCEQAPDKRARLDAFRDLAKTRLCKMYSSPADLGAKVSRSITQLKKQHPAIGWVRADTFGGAPSAEDVLKLREDNDRLRAQVASLSLAPPESAAYLACGEDPVTLHFRVTRKIQNEKGTGWRKLCDQWESVDVSWDAIFATLAPEFIERHRVGRWSLADLVWTQARGDLTLKYPGERLTDVAVSSDDWDTLLLQFRALNMLQCVDGDWQLTGYGDNYAAKLLGVPKGMKTRAMDARRSGESPA